MSIEERKDKFFIHESNQLLVLRNNLLQQMEGRFRVYLSIVTALVSLLAFIIGFAPNTGTLTSFDVLVIGLIFVFLCIIGFSTFVRILQAHISVTKYTRGLNRIRRFYWDVLDVEEQKHILLPIYDSIPEFGHMGDILSESKVMRIGLEGTIAIINAFMGVFATFTLCVSLFSSLLSVPVTDPIVNVIAIAIGSGAGYCFYKYHWKHLDDEKQYHEFKSAQHFPKPES